MRLADRTVAARGFVRGMTAPQRSSVARVLLLLADGNYSELGHSLHEIGCMALAMDGVDTANLERRGPLTPEQAHAEGLLAIVERSEPMTANGHVAF